jgi:SnoaL-like domain
VSSVLDQPSPREAIAALVHRYSDAVVQRDAARWGSCWAETARWHLGPGRSVEGRSAIVDLWVMAMGGMAAVVQMVNNGAVHFDGDGDGVPASGRWYINEHYVRTNGTTGLLLAHYDDTYVVVGGEWLFASRTLVPHYQGPSDLSGQFLNTVDRAAP